MAWVKIDDQFYDDPRWADAPGDSVALWLAAMAWCNRNESIDGFIPEAKTKGLVAVRNPVKTTDDLVRRGAFRKARGGFFIKSYVEYQQPEKVQEIRKKRSDNGRKGAAVRWGERARAAEYDDAPMPDEPPAEDMANAIANATPLASPVATPKKCPDTRLPGARPTHAAAATHVSTPQPAEATSAETPPDHQFSTPAAAAALDLFIEHRCAEERPHNPGGFRKTLRNRDIPRSEGIEVAAYLATNPDATTTEILRYGFGLSELAAHLLVNPRSA